MAAMADDAAVQIPCHVVRDILRDGSCPLHLRTQLSRLLAGGSPEEESSHTGCFFDGIDGECASTITSFLPLADLLAARAASSELLHNAMRHVSHVVEEGASHQSTMCSDPESNKELGAEPPAKQAVVFVHDRIRVRLWLQRLGDITSGCADEAIFESRMRSFVDTSMRYRMEAEVAAAKQGMEEEVRAAKLNMLQCVQAISDEVDRRVREKVAALQEEFDRRAGDQDKALRDMVEDRFSQQTAAMKAEVDRRTTCIRGELESRAKIQEDVACRLQEEVTSIRNALEYRVHEQELTVIRLTLELESLRAAFAELFAVRESLEGKLIQQEDAVLRLTRAFQPLQAECRALSDKQPDAVLRLTRAFQPLQAECRALGDTVTAHSSKPASRDLVAAPLGNACACWAWMGSFK